MQTTDSTHRLYLFSDKPQIPFFPIGFLGLLLVLGSLLFGVFRFAKVDIENNVVQSVSELLQQEGYGWVSVTASGQHVTLSGTATQEEGEKALALAKQAMGDTWLGQLNAPIAVKGIFAAAEVVEELPDEPASIAEPVIDVHEPMVATSVVTTLPSQWGHLLANLDGGTLTLSGLVASEARLEEIRNFISTHSELAHVDRVVDEMDVATGELMQGSQELEQRVLESISLCQSGTVASEGGSFSIDCQTRLQDSSGFESLANKPLQWGALGAVHIDTTDDCNQLLGEKLSEQKIHFAFSSAELKASSQPLLDELAQLLSICPRDIVVEGHTDSSGELAFNMALSEERASSVVTALVARGIDERRIEAKGYGPSRPIAEGSSLESRAANRRIEIHLVNGAN